MSELEPVKVGGDDETQGANTTALDAVGWRNCDPVATAHASDGDDRQGAAQVVDKSEPHGPTPAHDDHDDDSEPELRMNQAAVLVDLASDAELFHNSDKDAFATISVNGHRETHSLRSSGFLQWLRKRYWEAEGKPARSQPLHDAINTLASKAIFEGCERQVAVRLAMHENAIYLDLLDSEWRAVGVTSAGWRVLSDPPVRFVRRRGMLALPVPVAGGRVDELRQFVNVPDDDTWTLVKSWMLGALHPKNKYPILVVNGEHGSAKTTLSRMVRAMIDPNHTDLRSAPKDERDLMIAANNGWVVGFDNLSKIPDDLSDSLCRLATGGGFATRQLYTDDEEKLFNGARPIILNGIEELGTRPDLIDRVIHVSLPTISAQCRKPESDLWAAFYDARPRILGALLTAVSEALRNLPTVRLTTLPRMADFAKWVVAGEPALSIAPAAFLRAYDENRTTGNQRALEVSTVAQALLSLMSEVECWRGTPKQLLEELTARHTDERARRRHDWPSHPRALCNALKRLAPSLRHAGVHVEFPPTRTKHGTVVAIERCGESSSPSAPSTPQALPGDDGADSVDVAP